MLGASCLISGWVHTLGFPRADRHPPTKSLPAKLTGRDTTFRTQQNSMKVKHAIFAKFTVLWPDVFAGGVSDADTG